MLWEDKVENSYLTYTEKLRGKYKKKYEQVEEYSNILLENVDSKTKNKIMNKVLEEFMQAQEEKVHIDNITGENVEVYCEEVCSNLPIKYKMQYLFELFKYWAFVILMFDGLEFFFNYEKNILNIKSSLGNFLTSISICFLIARIYKLISKRSIRKEIDSKRFNIFTGVILQFIYIVLTILVAVLCEIKININVPTIFFISSSILVLIIYKIVYRKDKYYKINQAYQIASEEMKNAKDDLYNLNKKYNRKGKNKITQLEYLKIKVAKATNELKNNKFNLIIPILFASIASVFTLLNGNIVDTLLFFFVICILEYFIFMPMYKFTKEYNKLLLEKYSYIEKNNIPIKEWE